jgi:hypothetical protein
LTIVLDGYIHMDITVLTVVLDGYIHMDITVLTAESSTDSASERDSVLNSDIGTSLVHTKGA